MYEDVETLRILLDGGADPNGRNENNNTALTYAAEAGRAESLKILLEVPGIDVNAIDNDGDSALLCAVHGGKWNTTKLLLERPDVDRSIRNKLGVTAEELAVRDNKRRIMRLFNNEVKDDDDDDSIIDIDELLASNRGRDRSISPPEFILRSRVRSMSPVVYTVPPRRRRPARRTRYISPPSSISS